MRLDNKFIVRGVILLMLVVLVLCITILFWDYTQDDVFITYTYSRNIAEGNGFVFHPGERVQGSTTPLWAILMSGIYFITTDLLHAGNALSAILLLTVCGIIFLGFRDQLTIYGRMIICLLLVTSPLVYVSFGMETMLYSALLFASLMLWGRGQYSWSILVAGLLTWTRADGLVLGGTLGLVALQNNVSQQNDRTDLNWKIFPWKLVGIYVLTIAPWFFFAWHYFGSPLPNTFSAKQGLFEGLLFLEDGVKWWKSFYGNNWISLLALPFILVGGWHSLKKRSLRPLALWSIFYTIGYSVLNVSMFWYYTPLVSVLIFLAVVGGEQAAKRVQQKGISRQFLIGTAFLLTALTAGLGTIRAEVYGDPPPRVHTYRLVGQWINTHVPPQDNLLVGDLGIMGYYAQRSTLDVPGLISPGMHFKREDYAVAKYRPDLVVATNYWTWQQLVEEEWYHQYYQPLVKLSTEHDEFSPITIYERRYPLNTPARVISGGNFAVTCEVSLSQGESIPQETRLRLTNSEGNVVIENAQPFLAGRYPSEVAIEDELLYEQIVISADVPAGMYSWDARCPHEESGVVDVISVKQASTYTAVAKTWGDFARLEGYYLPDGPGQVWSGGVLRIGLYWHALQTIEQDLSVFLHLINDQNVLVAQNDGYPNAGLRPTSDWEQGEFILDIREIQIPPDLPEGEYGVVVGLYDAQSGKRISLSGELEDNGALSLMSIHNRWPGGSGLP